MRIKFLTYFYEMKGVLNMEDKQIKNFIHNELSNFNFKMYTKGTRYLEEAIYICIKEDNAIENLTKNVFHRIALKHNEKSYLSVKWCIEQVLKTMYNNTKMDVICNYFNIDENLKPSLKFIIYTISCKYTNQNKSL